MDSNVGISDQALEEAAQEASKDFIFLPGDVVAGALEELSHLYPPANPQPISTSAAAASSKGMTTPKELPTLPASNMRNIRFQQGRKQGLIKKAEEHEAEAKKLGELAKKLRKKAAAIPEHPHT